MLLYNVFPYLMTYERKNIHAVSLLNASPAWARSDLIAVTILDWSSLEKSGEIAPPLTNWYTQVRKDSCTSSWSVNKMSIFSFFTPAMVYVRTRSFLRFSTLYVCLDIPKGFVLESNVVLKCWEGCVNVWPVCKAANWTSVSGWVWPSMRMWPRSWEELMTWHNWLTSSTIPCKAKR